MIQTETEALIDRINKLPEIEFVEILGAMAEYMKRNSCEHLIDECFDVSDYSQELEDAERALSDMEDEMGELVDKIYAATKRCDAFELTEGGYDIMSEEVDEFINQIKSDLL